MILQSLELKNFGRFHRGRFVFEPGLNLLLGPNGAGKSTLMEGFPAAIFGVRKKDRFRHWGKEGDCQVAVEFSHKDGSVRITRDILSDEVLLHEKNDNGSSFCFEGRVSPCGRSSEREEYLDRISSYLGVAEEEIFRASLFYSQGSLEVAPRGELEGKIRKLLSGSAEVDYDQVLTSLLEDYFKVTRRNPWGKDKLQERELEKVRGKILEVDRRRQESRERIERLETLQERIAGLRSAIEKLQEEVEKGGRYLHWLRNRLAMAERENRLQEDHRRLQQEAAKVERLHREKEELEKSLGDLHLPEETAAMLHRMIPEIRELRRQSLVLEEQIDGVLGRLPIGQGTFWGKVFLLLLSLGGAGAMILRHRPDLLVPVAVTAGTVLSVVSLKGLMSCRRLAQQRHLIREQAQFLEEDLEDIRHRLREMERVLERMNLQHGESELEALRETLRRQSFCQQRLREIHGALAVLMDRPRLDKANETVAREIAILREQAGEGGAIPPPEELPVTEKKLTLLKKRLNDRELELTEHLREESFLLGELGDYQSLEDETEFLKEREKFLLEQKSVLALAYDLLSDAEKDFRRESLKKFSAEIGRWLALVTAGKYGQIRMEDGFRFLLKEKEGGWQPLDRFSRGTVDAVFFAIRLVLTRQLFGGRRLPLLLDDPMVNFDSQRLADTLRYLETTASQHQILLFSHNRGLLSLIDRDGWRVMALEE
ncbi:MAG: AAA family ATPase [Desulfuromonadaceae bacterium]|nr:AAA family ATPase [Desulfuromonadaceae bacterium]